METLKPLNILYDHEHWLTQQDVDMANGYVELIERTRSEKTPQIGDRLIYVDRYGKYYGNALIENNDEESGRISICEEPYIPFVWEQDANTLEFINTGKREGTTSEADGQAAAADNAPVPPADMPQDGEEDLPF